MSKRISGFSKLSKEQKLSWLDENYSSVPCEQGDVLREFWIKDNQTQKILDGFSENTVSNYFLPFGLAPNFLIDGKTYCVPMVIEESSVVAAAAASAKYWMDRGGIKTTILGMVKVGQIHFKWLGRKDFLLQTFDHIKTQLIDGAKSIMYNMEKRGGGILKIELIDFTDQEQGLYQIRVHFDTRDSMGANFINSVLENFAKTLEQYFEIGRAHV